MRKNFIS